MVSDAAILFPASPCPHIFKYEDDSTAGDRWYGEFVINQATSVIGLSLRITLDRPSHLLVVSIFMKIIPKMYARENFARVKHENVVKHLNFIFIDYNLTF